ncbi:hypothetical protein K458DRAFT_113234 [Lentithecium fluviatile CBS 122367]|uniref:Uncharacterized protein n=1 Tax=Lentithecium fluviatile CBS 122367 TaxID=1168545 RepID=A0A6G1IN96_9PLEO|nr:hypothetical protein K458DRAFT_113234 [Lentithecium fluviatile CBS 122367]
MQSIRKRNFLIVQRQQVGRASSKQKQLAKGVSKHGRYDILRRTRTINSSIKELDRELDSQCAAYSQALLLPFTSAMHSMLPREIRDLIYGNLLSRVDSHNFRHHLSHLRMPKNMWVSKPKVLPWIYTWKHPHHYEDSRFVGLDFARELIETYWHVCTFSIRSSSLHILETFLRQDPFGYDVVVGRNLSRLEIVYGFDRPGMTLCRKAHNYIVNTEWAKRLAVEWKESLQRDLAPLVQLKRRLKVKISVGVWLGAIGLFQFQNTAAALIPFTAALKDNGANVEVQINQHLLKNYGMDDWVGSWIMEDAHTQLGDAAKKYRAFCIKQADAALVKDWETNFAAVDKCTTVY